MIIDVEELGTMPTDVLRAIRQLIDDQLHMRRDASHLTGRLEECLRKMGEAENTQIKNYAVLQAAVDRWNRSQSDESSGIF
jgi:hypothetical protein